MFMPILLDYYYTYLFFDRIYHRTTPSFRSAIIYNICERILLITEPEPEPEPDPSGRSTLFWQS